MEVNLMLSSPRKSMVTLSMPMPPPAWGGQPNLKESMYAWIVDKSMPWWRALWEERKQQARNQWTNKDLHKDWHVNGQTTTSILMLGTLHNTYITYNTYNTSHNTYWIALERERGHPLQKKNTPWAATSPPMINTSIIPLTPVLKVDFWSFKCK